MKRWLICLGLIGTMAFLSGKESAGTDVALLQPVQVVTVSRQGDQIILRCDTGEEGAGGSVLAAVEDLKKGAISEIFLDTAEYLLLTPDSLDLIEELSNVLRPSCSLCLSEGEPKLSDVAQFLRLRKAGVTILDYRAEPCALPVLFTEKGRMELVQ